LRRVTFQDFATFFIHWDTGKVFKSSTFKVTYRSTSHILMKMAMNRTHVAEEYFMASMIKKKNGGLVSI